MKDMLKDIRKPLVQAVRLIDGLLEELNKSPKQSTRKTVIKPHNNRIRQLLALVGRHDNGLPMPTLLDAMKGLGYQSAKGVGGYFKGKNASFTKIALKSGEERVVLTPRGWKQLEKADQGKGVTDHNHVALPEIPPIHALAAAV